MYHEHPSQLIGSKKWRYCRQYKRGIEDLTLPLGYCAEKNCSHDTPGQARECYRRYCLDHAQPFIKNLLVQPVPCDVCGEPTIGGININTHIIPLCDSHRTHECLEQVFTVGDAFGS